MSVGIFMPAYNVGKYIEASIESILLQTHSDWELVIMDDLSGDDTLAQAERSASSKIRVFGRETHSGRIGSIKNEAISKLSPDHEYLCHVGSDDIIPSWCLKTFVDFMDANKEIGACCGNFVCFDDTGKQWTFPHVSNTGAYDSGILLRYMCFFPMRFYRASAIRAVGGYSEELTSAVDYDLALRLDEKVKMHRIKDPVTYYYRQHSEQVSTRARPEQDLNAKKALEAALKRRAMDFKVVNCAPPFTLEPIGKPEVQETHFIWGKGEGQ